MTHLGDVRDVFRGAVASLFGFGGRLIARAILMIFAGRAFGVEALGHLGQVAAISEIAAAVCVMGLKRSLLDMLSFETEHGRAPERRIAEALGVAVAVGCSVGAALTGIWWSVFPESHYLLPLLFVVVPAFVLSDVSLTAIKFRRIIKWDVAARCIFEPWGFLILTGAVWALGWKVEGLIIAYVGSVIIAAGISLIGLHRVYGLGSITASMPKLTNWPLIIRKSAPVGITDVGGMALRRIDLVVLSAVLGADAAGLYYMAQQLVSIPYKVNSLFEPMLSPVIARLHNRLETLRIRDNLMGVCRWVFIIQLALTIPMIVFGDHLLSLFGPEFTAGAAVLAIILVAELIDGSFANTETPLVYAKPKIPPALITMTLIIEVMVIAGLSIVWGAEGAALGYLFTIIFLAAGRLLMLRKHLGISVIGSSYILPILLGLCITSALILSRMWGPQHGLLTSAYIMASLAMFAGLIKVFGMTKSDRVLLRAVTRKRPKVLP